MDENYDTLRIAWGITGAGHFLAESVDILLSLKHVDVFVSLAAKEVLVYYDLWDKIEESGKEIFLDNSYSAIPVTKLYTGKYDYVVISPLTGNTMAKFVCGIADNLVSNLFAHGGKCNIYTIILPCDIKEKTESLTHKNEKVIINMRDIERNNLEKMKKMKNVMIAEDIVEIKHYLKLT